MLRRCSRRWAGLLELENHHDEDDDDDRRRQTTDDDDDDEEAEIESTDAGSELTMVRMMTVSYSGSLSILISLVGQHSMDLRSRAVGSAGSWPLAAG